MAGSVIVALHENTHGPHISITGSDATLRGNALTSLALLLREFTTNAAKYGALSKPAGQLAIDIVTANEVLKLNWVERGSPDATGVADCEGFGTVLEKAVLKGLKGILSLPTCFTGWFTDAGNCDAPPSPESVGPL